MDAHLLLKIHARDILFGVLKKDFLPVTHIILDLDIAIEHNLLPIAAWCLGCIVMDHAHKLKLIQTVIVHHMVTSSDLIVDALDPR
jgi:hypothetical protein